jgi:hypothetical protein
MSIAQSTLIERVDCAIGRLRQPATSECRYNP